jgi:hypothetical protein
MNRLFSAKPLLAAAVALGAVGAASTAQAHTDVTFSIGVPAPVYVEPAPVYAQPAPVYVQPAPVYVQPYRVYERPYRIVDRGYYGRHHGREYGAWGDRDHDGVPNRFDRAPYNPYRR